MEATLTGLPGQFSRMPPEGVACRLNTLQVARINDRATTSPGFTIALLRKNSPGPVVFSSSNPGVVEVSSAGVVTLKSPGFVTLAIFQAAVAGFGEAYLTRTFQVVLGDTTPSDQRLAGGGFRAPLGGYTPPTHSWVSANANMSRRVLTEADEVNGVILIDGARYYDQDTFASRYFWGENELEIPVFTLNFATDNPNRIVRIINSAFSTNRGIVRGSMRLGTLEAWDNNFIAQQYPEGIWGRAAHQILSLEKAHLDFHHNFADGKAGIYLASCPLNMRLRKQRNVILNLNGYVRQENGQIWNAVRQYLQVNGPNSPDILVEYNTFRCEPETGKDYYIEDAISGFGWNCSPAKPAVIQHNFFDTGGYSRPSRLVYNGRGAVQNGYSGTSGMVEAGGHDVIYRNNTVLQYPSGFLTYANNNRYENNILACTGYYETGPFAGTLIPCGNGGLAAVGVSGNVFESNYLAAYFHERNTFEQALAGDISLVQEAPGGDTRFGKNGIRAISLGQVDPGNTISNVYAWNSLTRQFENPPYFNNKNGGGPNDYNGFGLADNQLIGELRAAENAKIAEQATQGQFRGPR